MGGRVGKLLEWVEWVEWVELVAFWRGSWAGLWQGKVGLQCGGVYLQRALIACKIKQTSETSATYGDFSAPGTVVDRAARRVHAWSC